MKKLEITTTKGQVTLTYSEVAKKWDYFKGSSEAANLLMSMCADMGWVWNMKLKNYWTNHVAENAELFAADAKVIDINELWK
jgi:hypothetical protein